MFIQVENLLVAAYACPSVTDPCVLDTYWTAGTRSGWARIDPDSTTVHSNYTYEAWNGSTRDSAGWIQTRKDNLAVIDPRTGPEWEMFEAKELKGFVCEIPLNSNSFLSTRKQQSLNEM